MVCLVPDAVFENGHLEVGSLIYLTWRNWKWVFQSITLSLEKFSKMERPWSLARTLVVLHSMHLYWSWIGPYAILRALLE